MGQTVTSFNEEKWIERLSAIIKEHLKPHVRKIDAEAYYPAEYLKALGEQGFLHSSGIEESLLQHQAVLLIEETSKVCMTTGFNLWCHLALLTYLRHSSNEALQQGLLKKLENGKLLGGTGLSNPMKFYADMDPLFLKAIETDNGYLLSGKLPMVSNLGEDHWFAAIAQAGEKRIMVAVPCYTAGLTITEQTGFLGLNGSATYSCQFKEVFISKEWVIAEYADLFVKQVRQAFILYQVPLGTGLIAASIEAIEQARNKQGGSNRYLPVQAADCRQQLGSLRKQMLGLARQPSAELIWEELIQLRLAAVKATIEAVHAAMLHQGSAGYQLSSHPCRRLREAYFMVNLTPTVRHLEKLIHSFEEQEDLRAHAQ